jgi:hypothetical protein
MKEFEKDMKGKIYCIPGSQELILLKCPYYPE